MTMTKAEQTYKEHFESRKTTTLTECINAAMSQHAMEFQKWLRDNKWEYTYMNETYHRKTIMGTMEYATTSELYDQFNQSNQHT